MCTARTYARYFMPFLITGFREAFPKIKINLDEGSSLDMIQSLINLENEVAIISRVGNHPDVCFIPFSREDVVLILHPEHHLARRDMVAFEDLAEEVIIMKEKGSGTRMLVNNLFAKHDRSPNIMMESSDAEVIKLLVQHGEGISFLVRESVSRELREGRLATVPLENTELTLNISIAYLKDQPLSPPARIFIGSLEGLGIKAMRLQDMSALMARTLKKKA